MNPPLINLEDYRTPGSKVFTGRDRGSDVRKKSKIDQLAEVNNEIIVEVPADIRSINPSFLEELLYNIVPKFGKEGFYKRVKFQTQGTRYNIAKDVEEAVDRILRKSNALSFH